ncbi:hypothetical protein GOV04_00595 [Candidatus Woesearchaeota archaeon]|nr:hypothetical protein [Candidatus Woesearchaeota archaeon]
MNKRGQLTVFIIIGIILIVSTALIFFIRSQITDSQKFEEPTLETVPTEYQPLQQFITQCLQTTSKEAIIKIGMQGGYISTSVQDIDLTGGQVFRASVTDPTSAGMESVQYSPNNNLKVPYWWYLDSSNTCNTPCQFDSKMPPLRKTDEALIISTQSAIEVQIERYVEQQLPVCLGGFEQFKTQGFSVEVNDNPEVTAHIARLDTAVALKYPLELKREGLRSTKIENFIVRHDVNLQRAYDAAQTVLLSNVQNEYFERPIIQAIAAFSGVDENKLPPMASYGYGDTPVVTWQKSAVEEPLTDLLAIHTPLYQVVGTNNYQLRSFDSELQTGLYKSFNMPIASMSAEDYSELNINFVYYDWWPIYYDITGENSDQTFVRPTIIPGLRSILPFIPAGMDVLDTVLPTSYIFNYDLSYPMIVTINDPTAFNGEGYTFQYALEVNIRNNYPLNGSIDDLLNPTRGELSDLFHNPLQRNSGNITIRVSDKQTGEPVLKPSITFVCGRQRLQLDSSTLYAEDSDGTVITRLPVCLGGKLLVSAKDYFSPPINLSTEIGRATTVRAKLRPIRTLNLTVKIQNLTKQSTSARYKSGWYLDKSLSTIGTTQTVLVSLERKPQVYGEQPFNIIASFDVNNQVLPVKIIPGEYKASITTTYELPSTVIEELVIPEDRICVKRNFLGQCTKRETIPQIVFNETIAQGSLNFEFEVSDWSIEDANTMTVYTIVAPGDLGYYELEVTNDLGQVTKPNALKHDDLNILGESEELVEEFQRPYLEPTYE